VGCASILWSNELHMLLSVKIMTVAYQPTSHHTMLLEIITIYVAEWKLYNFLCYPQQFEIFHDI
jgi:hypothetical protein